MTDQEKVQLVADLLFHDRQFQQSIAAAVEKRFERALKALLKELLGREATDQEIENAENL